jgi:serine/threonine protein kinase
MTYQMLTGVLPYFSPNPAQIEKLVAQGRCTPPKLRNTQIPREVSDIVMKSLNVEVSERYQRASELLDDLATAAEIDHNATAMEDIRRRLRAREVPKRGFCWHCRKAGSPSTPAARPARSAGRSNDGVTSPPVEPRSSFRLCLGSRRSSAEGLVIRIPPC